MFVISTEAAHSLTVSSFGGESRSSTGALSSRPFLAPDFETESAAAVLTSNACKKPPWSKPQD